MSTFFKSSNASKVKITIFFVNIKVLKTVKNYLKKLLKNFESNLLNTQNQKISLQKSDN